MIEFIDTIMAALGYVSRKREYDILMDENREFFDRVVDYSKMNEELEEEIERHNSNTETLLTYINSLEEKVEKANDIIDSNLVGLPVVYKTDYIGREDIKKLQVSYMITREEIEYMRTSAIDHKSKIKYDLFRKMYEDFISCNEHFYNERRDEMGNIIYELRLNIINKRVDY